MYVEPEDGFVPSIRPEQRNLSVPWAVRHAGAACLGSAIDSGSGVAPREDGAPGGIRTPDVQLRRLALYPAELQARAQCQKYYESRPARHFEIRPPHRLRQTLG